MATEPIPKNNVVQNYVPKGRYKKAKYTAEGSFKVANTDEPYQGYYIEVYGGKFFAGSTPEEKGAELTKIQKSQIDINSLLPFATVLAAGLFNRKLTKPEIAKGSIKRYFIQDKKTNKIQEADQQTYQDAKKQLVNRVFVEADWIVKGPAEDMSFGAYKYEGAASRNKKTVQVLEKQLPGISTYIVDYSYLVQEPTPTSADTTTTQTFTESQPQIDLDNSRKANFDTRK